MAIHYRDEEAIYVRASHDRVTVVFSTVFKDETDRIFGKVFLQEFVDARRLASLQTAPQVLYSSRDPPLEIRNVPGLKRSEDVGYVTFGKFKEMYPIFSSSSKTHIDHFTSPLPATLLASNSRRDNIPHSALQRLPALSHQMLQSLHAQSYAPPCERVSENPQSCKARTGWRKREEDNNVRNSYS